MAVRLTQIYDITETSWDTANEAEKCQINEPLLTSTIETKLSEMMRPRTYMMATNTFDERNIIDDPEITLRLIWTRINHTVFA